MNILNRILPNVKRKSSAKHNENNPLKETTGSFFQNHLTFYDDFSIFDNRQLTNDTYLLHAWVNIAVNILIRNIARADFTIKSGGEDVDSGIIYDLFHKPNPLLSRFDLWKETAAWWHLEGEAFWWFGPDYSGGIPKEIYVLKGKEKGEKRKEEREDERAMSKEESEVYGDNAALYWGGLIQMNNEQ